MQDSSTKDLCQMKAASYGIPAILGFVALFVGIMWLFKSKPIIIGIILIGLGGYILGFCLLFWIVYFGTKRTHPGDWEHLASCIFPHREAEAKKQ